MNPVPGGLVFGVGEEIGFRGLHKLIRWPSLTQLYISLLKLSATKKWSYFHGCSDKTSSVGPLLAIILFCVLNLILLYNSGDI